MTKEFRIVPGQYSIGFLVRLVTVTPNGTKNITQRSFKGPFPMKEQAQSWLNDVQPNLTDTLTAPELHEKYRAMEIPTFSQNEFSPQLAIFKEKHGDRYYLIYKAEDFQKVCLKLIKERNEYGYYSHLGREKEPVAPSFTKESIPSLPSEFQKEALNTWNKYARDMKWFKESTELYELKNKALSGDLQSAGEFISSMCGGEYEGYEIVEPDTY